MGAANTFFLQGEASDPGYRHVRDLPHWHDARAFTESLWPKYRHLADPHFRSDAQHNFNERFWEMYLACALIDHGLELHRFGNEGPEFYFNSEGHRVWVEAVAPNAGTGPDRVLEPENGVANNVPSDQIVLRYTSVLKDKLLKLQIAISKGIVSTNDRVILAVNSRGIPHAPYHAEIPFILKAVFPIGALAFAIDRQTLKLVDSHHQYRPELQKKNRSIVSTQPFLDPEYTAFCGLLHSSVDCANHPINLGDDFFFVHNPSATYHLPKSLFSWSRQFEYLDDQLTELPRQV